MSTSLISNLDWVQGDLLGLQIPAHSSALKSGAEPFLTKAFRAAGALGADNQVTRITQFEECPGGSTGSKLLLGVEYEKPAPQLHTQLFVKFSRDFTNPIRDRSKNQLEPEVRLGLLSRSPGFPIAVPVCYFADYHLESGTGILITQRVEFGKNGVERPYEKCRDYEMPAPLEHYKVLLRAVARLAGTHRSGRLAGVANQFPFDADKAVATDRIRYSEKQLLNRVARYTEFSGKFPQLLPAHIRSKEFIAQLALDIPRFLQHELLIKQFLHGNPDLIALCHWNANVDNAWFWLNERRELECGLMDWGHVGQMNCALALFGCLSGAEIGLFDKHLVELLELFVAEYRSYGGPAIDVQELKLNFLLFVSMMGLAWLLDAPALILTQFSAAELADIKDRFDTRFTANETARVQLHMFTNVLNLWQTHEFGRMLDSLLERCGAGR